MNFQKTFEKVENSDTFQNFIKEHSDADLVAGFFILDFSENNNKQSLDYKINETIYTFSVEDEVKMTEDKLIKAPNKPELKPFKPEFKIEVDELKSRAQSIATENKISAKFKKIIAVLQLHNEKLVWNLTCMLEGFIILNIIIDANTGEIEKFTKSNMSEFIKPGNSKNKK